MTTAAGGAPGSAVRFSREHQTNIPLVFTALKGNYPLREDEDSMVHSEDPGRVPVTTPDPGQASPAVLSVPAIRLPAELC